MSRPWQQFLRRRLSDSLSPQLTLAGSHPWHILGVRRLERVHVSGPGSRSIQQPLEPNLIRTYYLNMRNPPLDGLLHQRRPRSTDCRNDKPLNREQEQKQRQEYPHTHSHSHGENGHSHSHSHGGQQELIAAFSGAGMYTFYWHNGRCCD